jgi:hypothetical protein
MDEKIVQQILDHLFSSFENSETQSAALLLFLKDQGIATEEKLAPYFEQAGKTSEVRWRAARVRMGALLASAMKAPEPVAVAEKITPTEEKIEPTADVDSKGTGKQIPGQKSAGPKNATNVTSATETSKVGKGVTEPAQKNQEKPGDEAADSPPAPAK